MLSTILLFLFSTNGISAWSGIVMDGYYSNTQVYVPGNPPVNTPNVDFGLSHLPGQAAVMLYGKAYFIGGGYRPTNLVTIFDSSTNTSTSGAPLNVVRYAHAAIVVDETIIVCGGYNSYEGILSSCEQYNPSTQKWNMITSLPTSSKYFAMATLNNRAYTFGGSEECVSASSPVYMFDGQNWEPRSSIAGLPHQWHAGIAIDANRALICGGWADKEGSCQPVSDCFIYSASSDSWTQAASMAQRRCWHSMVMFEGVRSTKLS
jgi:N-acetylneuraminic acid mutarotase